MIVVETSVWIDFLHGRKVRHARRLRTILGADKIVVDDLTLCEVLQGERSSVILPPPAMSAQTGFRPRDSADHDDRSLTTVAALSNPLAPWARRLALALALAWAGALPASAQPSVAKQEVGVIFLHGRLGSPDYLAPLLQALRAEGYRAETPAMSWSRTRVFDSTVDESMAEIDTVVSRLRAQGARRLIVAGHSLGGAAALRYGATRQQVDGLILVAASWNPAAPGWQRIVGESVARARTAIDAGRDRATDTYHYVANDGSAASVVAVARGFHDFNRSDSPMGVPASARAVKRALPVLWLSAGADSLPARDTAAKAFAALPRHAKSRQETIASSHSGAATAAIPVISVWLDEVRR